jgi:hypothetical protein
MHTNSLGGDRLHKNRRIRIVVAVATIMGIMGVAYLGANGPSLEITHPSDGSKVQIGVTVRGTSQNMPEGYKIWVIVYCPEVDRYYPQDCAENVQGDGKWASRALIGVEGEGDVGKEFEIILIFADPTAHDILTQYVEWCTANGSWPGLEELPEGVIVYDSVSVIRM